MLSRTCIGITVTGLFKRMWTIPLQSSKQFVAFSFSFLPYLKLHWSYKWASLLWCLHFIFTELFWLFFLKILFYFCTFSFIRVICLFIPVVYCFAFIVLIFYVHKYISIKSWINNILWINVREYWDFAIESKPSRNKTITYIH